MQQRLSECKRVAEAGGHLKKVARQFNPKVFGWSPEEMNGREPKLKWGFFFSF